MKTCALTTTAHSLQSTIGTIFIKSCHVGVHEISLDSSVNDKTFSPYGRCKVPDEMEKEDKDNLSTPAKLCIQWLNQYFEDPTQLSELSTPKLCPLDGESFRSRVWEALFSSVGVGETITYKELAIKLNNPGAVRAVGSAMRNNPLGIMVPCHRVLRKDSLGLYHGGERQRVKEWLLQHEGASVHHLKKR